MASKDTQIAVPPATIDANEYWRRLDAGNSFGIV